MSAPETNKPGSVDDTVKTAPQTFGKNPPAPEGRPSPPPPPPAASPVGKAVVEQQLHLEQPLTTMDKLDAAIESTVQRAEAVYDAILSMTQTLDVVTTSHSARADAREKLQKLREQLDALKLLRPASASPQDTKRENEKK